MEVKIEDLIMVIGQQTVRIAFLETELAKQQAANPQPSQPAEPYKLRDTE